MTYRFSDVNKGGLVQAATIPAERGGVFKSRASRPSTGVGFRF